MKCPVCQKIIFEPHYCKFCDARVVVPLDEV